MAGEPQNSDTPSSGGADPDSPADDGRGSGFSADPGPGSVIPSGGVTPRPSPAPMPKPAVGRVGRMLRSRGVRKLRRNRSAMVALAVIGLYLLVVGWMFVTQALSWVGFDLRDDPVMGFLLSDAPQEKIGPPEMAGFGFERDLANKVKAIEDWITLAEREIAEVKAEQRSSQNGGDASAGDGGSNGDRGDADPQADGERGGERGDGAPGEARSAQGPTGDAGSRRGLAERQLIDLPYPELQAMLDDVIAEQARSGTLAGVSGNVERLAGFLDEAERMRGVVDELERRLAEAGDDPGDDLLTDIEIEREQLGFALEDLAKPLGDFGARAASVGVEVTALEGLDTQALSDSAELLFDAAFEPTEPLADLLAAEGVSELWPADLRERIDNLKAEVAERIEVAEAEIINDALAKAEALYPIPDGVAGLVYRTKLLLGTDRQGRSILIRGLYSAKTAIQVGFVVAMFSVVFGSLLGASAAFFGGVVDHAVVWLYSTLSSIPSLVLLVVLQFMFIGTPVYGTLVPLYVAFSLSFWIGPCRVIRGEAMKIKELEYVQAATAIGFGRPYILVKHLIPNTVHLMFINFSLLFIGAIKSEVILTFLGLGLSPGEGASWGTMISQSKTQIAQEFFWQIGAATFFMFCLVLAFNILTDALQDAFDPKHVS